MGGKSFLLLFIRVQAAQIQSQIPKIYLVKVSDTWKAVFFFDARRLKFVLCHVFGIVCRGQAFILYMFKTGLAVQYLKH